MTKYKVIIDQNTKDYPEEHEIAAAIAVSKCLHCDVRFIVTASSRTPDFDIGGVKWELKSPLGNSSRTIENNLRTARGQSPNIILDLSRTRMSMNRALSRINHYLSRDSRVKHLMVLDKRGNLIDIL